MMKKTYKIEVDCANCAQKMEDAANTVASPITPQTHGNWQFVPAEWTAPAAKRDYQTMWGNR